MRVRVLGSAAGGGFPQWNCHCSGCRRARAGDPAVKPRTQASLAVSADGKRWVLLNASPDLPAQLRDNDILHPDNNGPARNNPIAAVIISGGDIDCITGLLTLREGHAFRLYAQDFVMSVLNANQVFSVMNGDLVAREILPPASPVTLHDASGQELGLRVEAFPVPGKIPLYQEEGRDLSALVSAESVIGLSVTDDAGKTLLFIPGCAHVTPEILERAKNAEIVFFDGTLWQDREMIDAGLSQKTGARMGHISVSGECGTIAAFSALMRTRKIFIHINNTNPILCDDSEEAKKVRDSGWDVAYDGMEVTL
ncbi:pyrroloquinoline quinone biosynthesis protein PqqB [Acidocella aminolytica]|uniref:pyrroloquinoline quinone biosynthesis protein PqqB n=1 Tax=Acidocella aminolytica TaxID=33998 RepID=UPI00066272AB|nr:pyrroloquinoline quinone biosynthesis protein PqqB [Acidocella aminolytica]SHE60473.1 pyrroloquinoline quinone biosynthesis protein B [Acidocella aminolytica 101 = DSM 11237]